METGINLELPQVLGFSKRLTAEFVIESAAWSVHTSASVSGGVLKHVVGFHVLEMSLSLPTDESLRMLWWMHLWR